MKALSKTFYLALLLLFSLNSGMTKNYKGAELRTKEAFTYGRFEVNYKPPAGDGFLASFFTYHDFTTGIQDWNEIDLEILGRYEDNIQFNTITPNQSNHDCHYHVPFNPHLAFHTYAFEWTPEYVAWFVDGEEVYRQTGTHISTLSLAQKLMMNIWIPDYENWVGEWNPQLLPKFAHYDWASYASYTPGQGNTGTDLNFTLQWKDEFNSWDTDRWDKATHTWQGNATDFVPENIVFQDGKMILCLTDSDDLGLVDNIPPYLLYARSNGKSIKLYFSEKLDPVTAQKTSVYFINGLTVENATLLPDSQKVVLQVDTLDTNVTYSVAVLGLKDQSINQNTQMGQVVSIINEQPLSFPININVGGDVIYGDYLADQSWGPEMEYGHLDGSTRAWNEINEISGTELDSIYFSELDGFVKYRVRVPQGVYSVVLHFCENEYDGAGLRQFEVVVEDSVIDEQIDLFTMVGKHAAYSVRINNINIQDGIIDISLNNWIRHSILNGLTVEQVSTGLNKKSYGRINSYRMLQNYPNPFNPKTIIPIELSKSEFIRVTVFNNLGQKIKEIISSTLQSGSSQLFWDGKNANSTDMPSGIYYVLATSNSQKQVIKMLLMR